MCATSQSRKAVPATPVMRCPPTKGGLPTIPSEPLGNLKRPRERPTRGLVPGQVGRERDARSPAHRDEHVAVAVDGLSNLDGQRSQCALQPRTIATRSQDLP